MKSHTAETAGHAGLAGPRHRFTARLPDSVVGWSLPAAHGTGNDLRGRGVLDAAAALGGAEGVLQALEDWLGCGLVPELVPASAPWSFPAHATGAPTSTDLVAHLPLSVLRSAGAPPPALLAGWTWQTLRCDLVFDTVPLTLADVQGLEPEALLLLPAAFASQWHGLLRPEGGQGGVHGARLYEQRGRLCAAAQGTAESHPPNDHATVRLAQPVDVPLPHLLGWGAAKAPALDTPPLLEAGAVRVHGSALVQGRALATGQLVPVGSGFAVRIGEVLRTAPPAMGEAAVPP